jgi:translation initiation factor IF-3
VVDLINPAAVVDSANQVAAVVFNKGGFRGRFVPRKEAEHRINNFIRVPQVRLVGENVEVGVYNTQDALRMAQDQQLDLVEISPTG